MTAPEPGRSELLEDGLRRVLAPNPGPMTHWGTNTFIIGEGSVAVVDPGPEDEAHLNAILRATEAETVTHILVTHAHMDHSPLAATLSRKTGAPVYGFGPAEAGRSPVMAALADAGLSGGGEGVDRTFAPDVVVTEGSRIEGDGWEIGVLHTPGHFSGHLAFAFADALISGDHVMDWSSSLVSPPDGDLGAFMRTSARLRDAGHARLYPAHGNAINDPTGRLAWLLDHRQSREAQILATLGQVPKSVPDLTASIYTDIPFAMLPAAERSVFAHLIDLHERNLARAVPRLSQDAQFSLV